MFRNLKKKTEKNLNEKEVKNKFFSRCATSVFDQKIVYHLFSMNDFFCTNYILIFIMRRSISTRSFKNSASTF